jgi:hypothetical protein
MYSVHTHLDIWGFHNTLHMVQELAPVLLGREWERVLERESPIYKSSYKLDTPDKFLHYLCTEHSHTQNMKFLYHRH